MGIGDWFKKKNPSAPSPQPSTEKPGHNPYDVWLGLRGIIFNAEPPQCNIPKDSPLAYAFAMEQTHLPQNVTTTVLAVLDGTLSLYISNGGGIIGTGGKPTVGEYVKGMVSSVHPFTTVLEKSEDKTPPPPGFIRFHIFTGQGHYVGQTTEADMRANQSHPLFPLYAGGQNLLTQIRINSQTSGTKPQQ